MNYKILTIAILVVSTSSALAIERTIDFEASEFKYTIDEIDGNAYAIPNNLTTFTTGDLTITAIGRTPETGSFKFATSPIDSPDYSNNFLINNANLNSIGLKFSFDDAVNSLSMNLGGIYQRNWSLQAFNDTGNLIDSLNIAGLAPYEDNDGNIFELSSEFYDISYVTLINQGEAFLGGLYEDQIIVDNFTYNTAAVSPVPEPATYALILGGLGMVGFMAYRRRKATNA